MRKGPERVPQIRYFFDISFRLEVTVDFLQNCKMQKKRIIEFETVEKNSLVETVLNYVRGACLGHLPEFFRIFCNAPSPSS